MLSLPSPRFRLSALCAAACASLWLVPGAHAQSSSSVNDPPPAEPALSAVKVTGTRSPAAASGYAARNSDAALGFSLSRRDTPQSVSVISRQQIDDFALTSVHDLLDQAPGIHVERVETDRTYYNARGFDIQTFQFDGIGMPFATGTQWGDLDTAVFERVDVLRGANGLLTSTGNPSATINFLRKRPTREFQAQAAVTLGSWNQRRVEGDVAGPLNAAGTVRGRLVLVRESKDSYLDRYSSDKTVVDGSLAFDLGRDTRLTLGYTEQRNNADSPMWGALPLHYTNGTPTNYDVSTSTAADWSWWNNQDRRAYAELTHELGDDWQLKATLNGRRLGTDSELFYQYGTPDAATGLGLYAYPAAFKGTYQQVAADVRASGTYTLAGRRHEAMFGVSASRETGYEHSGYGTDIGTAMPDLATWDGRYPKPTFDASSDGADWRSHRSSVYAVTRLNLHDRLKLIVGANTTRVISNGTNYGVDHVYGATSTSPYLGVVGDLSEAVSAYASVTRIFNPQTEVDVNQQVLAPIRGRSLEAGLKGEWLDKRLMGSAAVFRTRQENTAEAAGTIPNTVRTYYKGVDATSTGFELELAGKLAPGWDANASYTQFRLVDDEGQDARLYVPRRMLRLSTSAQVPGAPQLKLGGALRAQSAVRTTDGVDRQAGYALLDLMARYAFTRQWALTVNLRNVTDRKYLNSLYWNQAYYGAPRSVSATLQWTY